MLQRNGGIGRFELESRRAWFLKAAQRASSRISYDSMCN